MENYQKSKTVEKPSPLPFANLPPDIIEMKVKDGSKIRNLMGYAIGKMESEAMRQVLFSGVGKAISKTITCVEIMKRRMKHLHQITKVFFKQIEEIWEPIVPEVGLDPLTVKRNIPAICVLLSKDPWTLRNLGIKPQGPLMPSGWRHSSQNLKARPRGSREGRGKRGWPDREASSFPRTGGLLQEALRKLSFRVPGIISRTKDSQIVFTLMLETVRV